MVSILQKCQCSEFEKHVQICSDQMIHKSTELSLLNLPLGLLGAKPVRGCTRCRSLGALVPSTRGALVDHDMSSLGVVIHQQERERERESEKEPVMTPPHTEAYCQK